MHVCAPTQVHGVFNHITCNIHEFEYMGLYTMKSCKGSIESRATGIQKTNIDTCMPLVVYALYQYIKDLGQTFHDFPERTHQLKSMLKPVQNLNYQD